MAEALYGPGRNGICMDGMNHTAAWGPQAPSNRRATFSLSIEAWHRTIPAATASGRLLSGLTTKRFAAVRQTAKEANPLQTNTA